MWDLFSSNPPTAYLTPYPAPITDVAFSPDDTLLFAASNELFVWDLELDDSAYQVIDGFLETGLAIGGDFVASAQMTGDNTEFGRTPVMLRDWRTGTSIVLLQRQGELRGGSGTSELYRIPVAMRANGTQLASVDPAGVISLWDLSVLPENRGVQPTPIYAYCDDLPGDSPILATGEPIRIIWSWYATTLPLLNDHQRVAQYEITVNGEAQTAYALESPIRRDSINDDHWTLYYHIDIGSLAAGTHTVGYRLTWREAISDGLEAFGPETGQPENTGQCQFTVRNG